MCLRTTGHWRANSPSTGPAQVRCAWPAQWRQSSGRVGAWSWRQGPALARPSPTWCRPCSAASAYWSRRPARRCRISCSDAIFRNWPGCSVRRCGWRCSKGAAVICAWNVCRARASRVGPICQAPEPCWRTWSAGPSQRAVVIWPRCRNSTTTPRWYHSLPRPGRIVLAAPVPVPPAALSTRRAGWR